MVTRRRFLKASAAASLAAPRGIFAEPAGAPYRLLYSNDTTNITSCVSPWHKKGEKFRPEMLEASVDEVAALGVDVHLLQPGLGMVPMWPSKVLPPEEHYAWIKQRYGQSPDSFGNFVLNGGDVVKVFVDRCRLRGQAPFVSFRLNDAHHKEFVDPKPGAKPGSSIGMSVTQFYAEHPELRIKPGSLRGPDLVWNWSEPKVRAQKFELIRELCENYDLDGLELDFLRTYSFFRPEETTREQRCTIMTAFVKEVRALLDRTARSGRHRRLGARIPCYLPALDLLGLDLPSMLEAGLDMVNASAHYFTTQQHDLAAIRRQTANAALYFELCHSIWNGPKLSEGYDVFPFRRATPEQLKTSAHLAYSQGADGVSLFNFAYYREHGGPGRGQFGEPPFEVLKSLRDPSDLAKSPQHWFIASGWRPPGNKPLQVSREVVSGKVEKFWLDLAPPREGWGIDGRLRLQFARPPGEGRWRMKLNGTELKLTDDVSEPFANSYPAMLGKPGEMRAWIVPVAVPIQGRNHAEASLEGGGPATIVYLDLAFQDK